MSDNADSDAASGMDSAADAWPTLSLDAIFELLANRRRRFMLYSLIDAPDGVVDRATLTEEVATLAAAVDTAALTRDRVLDTASDLHHWHLPVVADVGLVDRDARTGTIRYVPHPALETWVARVRQDELSR